MKIYMIEGRPLKHKKGNVVLRFLLFNFHFNWKLPEVITQTLICVVASFPDKKFSDKNLFETILKLYGGFSLDLSSHFKL